MCTYGAAAMILHTRTYNILMYWYTMICFLDVLPLIVNLLLLKASMNMYTHGSDVHTWELEGRSGHERVMQWTQCTNGIYSHDIII